MSLAILVVYWILIDLVGRAPERRNFLWLTHEPLALCPLLTFYIPVTLLVIIILIILIDFLAYCFKRLDSFTDIDDWYTSGRLKLIRRNPPNSEETAAKLEMDMLIDLSYEVKYLMLDLSFRILLAMTIFIVGFAEIYALINRVSVNPSAFMKIGWDAGLPWHIFYSLDVLTTLGGDAPTPNDKNALIWWFSGFELAFSIVISILFLTLAITSIFETFGLKTSYIPLYAKYNLEKAKNHQHTEKG